MIGSQSPNQTQDCKTKNINILTSHEFDKLKPLALW